MHLSLFVALRFFANELQFFRVDHRLRSRWRRTWSRARHAHVLFYVTCHDSLWSILPFVQHFFARSHLIQQVIIRPIQKLASLTCDPTWSPLRRLSSVTQMTAARMPAWWVSAAKAKDSISMLRILLSWILCKNSNFSFSV